MEIKKDNLYKERNILELKIDGFQGPMDLLLSMVKDQKIDILKIQILPLAEQYLGFLKKIVKKDIEVAAEYLVMGSILAYIKSRELLPRNDDENDEIENFSEKLKFQMLKLAKFQSLSKSLLLRKQLGIDFFKRGEFELFTKKFSYKYESSLYDLTKVYAKLITKDNSEKIIIASSDLTTVEMAIKNLKSSVFRFKDWKFLSSFLPNEIKDYLERKSAFASYFVASLELARDGYILLKQSDNKNDLQMLKNN